MGSPIVLHANHFQFAAGQVLENPCVGSRMLLWCRQGQGEVVVDGQRRILTADAWLLLPWRHRVQYIADRRRPFLVGGIHLCPDHDRDAPPELRVPHRPEDPLQALACRRDAHWPGLEGMPGGPLDDHPRLRGLSEWIVVRWISDRVETDQAWAMGLLLAGELRSLAGGRPSAANLPSALAAALRLARADLARPMALTQLARAAGCSPASLVRMFRAHLNRSPMAWLRSERLEEARRLLASTGLPVAVVGRRVGIPDPHRFAKLFRASTGAAPRQWRLARRI